MEKALSLYFLQPRFSSTEGIELEWRDEFAKKSPVPGERTLLTIHARWKVCRDLEQGSVILGFALNVFVLPVLTQKSSHDDDTTAIRHLSGQLSSTTCTIELEQWINQDCCSVRSLRVARRICRRAQVL